MQHFKAPTPITTLDRGTVSIFLAGTIDMGAAKEWQQAFVDRFAHCRHRITDDLVFINPRRDAWDPSWEHTAANPEFNRQVTWELEGLEQADIVVMFLEKGSKSPISLMELGLLAREENCRLIVYCPKGFWRRGNVEILGQRYKFPVFEDTTEWFQCIDRAISHIRSAFDETLCLDLRTAWQWLEEMGPTAPTVLDPDGWHHTDGVTMDTSITQADFNFRLNQCTCLGFIPTSLTDAA